MPPKMTDEQWRETASHLTNGDLIEVASKWRKHCELTTDRLKALESATHVLLLNDMRFSNVEKLREVCIGTEAELQDLLDRESVELYSDGGWCKTYRKDGPLEWCNRPSGKSAIQVWPSVPPHVSEFEKLAYVRQKLREMGDCVEEPEPMSDITGCDY